MIDLCDEPRLNVRHVLSRFGAEPCELVQGRPFTIGRLPGCSLVLDASVVSLVHVEIGWEGDRAILRDRSTYGTLVGGKPVFERALVPGDEIQVGPFLFVYKVERNAGSMFVEPERSVTSSPSGAMLMGRIGAKGLAPHLRAFELDRKTGTLSILGGMAGIPAWIVFEDGVPRAAECGAARGEDAVLELLTLREGRFCFTPETRRATHRMTTPLAGLLRVSGAENGSEGSRFCA